MKLNTKQWQKVESHKDYTRFQDSKGNELKVAHKHLTPKYRKEIDELPTCMAEGGEVKAKKMADGGEVPDADAVKALPPAAQADPELDPAGPLPIAPPSAPDPKANFTNGTFDFDKYALNNPDKSGIEAQTTALRHQREAQEQAEAQKQAASMAEQQKYADFNAERAKAGLAPVTMPTGIADQAASAAGQIAGAGQAPAASSLGIASPASASPAPAAAPPGGSDPLGTGQMLDAYQGGLHEQLGGIQKQANAESSLAQQQAAIQNHALALQQDFQTQWEKKSMALQGTIDKATQAYAEGKIDPERFVSGMGTGDRFATAIGLIMGGMGAGVTGGENQALGLLKMRINNDIDAQKSEMTKRDNLVGMAYKQFGNMKDALEYSRAMQMNVLATQLNVAAAKSGDALAQARGMQTAGALKAQSAQMIGQLSRQQALMGIMGKVSQDPNYAQAALPVIRQIDPERAKELEGRLIPGVGVASVPVPNDVRATFTAKQTLNDVGRDFFNWAKQHSGSLDPKQIAIGRTKAAELQSLYRNSINGGVFKKGEQEFIDQIIDSDPTKFFNKIRVLPKLKEVLDNNENQLSTLKRGYGIPVGPSHDQIQAQRQSQYVNWAKQHPDDPRAKKILNQGN